MKYLSCPIMILALGILALADSYPRDPNIDIVHYTFKIELSDKTDEIVCEALIDVKFVSDGVRSFRLDLTNQNTGLEGKGMSVSSVETKGQATRFRHLDNSLQIELLTPSKANERQQFTIRYRGVPVTGLKIANNKYGDRTFFSDNWPDKGRNWLPTVDHPSDKATCDFIVIAPSHYQIVSNGLKIEETDLANGNRITHWRQSVPIASWLYVLGAARFAVQYVDQFEGKSIESWVYYQDRDKGFYDYGYVTKDALAFYSDRVGPFSYEKLANIQSNSVSGGMEAASAILYSENSVVGDRNTRWRNVIIHEIAHQWFGNSVTENDWNEVWISEGFATYFTLLFIEHKYGREEFLEGLRSSKRSVDAFYAKNPGYRIIHQDLRNMNDVTTSQIYQKGSWVLHMLRGIVGDEIFWKGIRNYYRKYKDGHATVADFRREMEEVSKKDLAQFFDQWLFKPGTLKYKGTWNYVASRSAVDITLDQVQTDGSSFNMPIEVAIYYPGRPQPEIGKVTVDSKSNRFSISVSREPEKVVVDPNMWVLMDLEFSKVAK